MNNDTSSDRNDAQPHATTLSTQPLINAGNQDTVFGTPQSTPKQEVSTPLLVVLVLTFIATASVLALIVVDLMAGVASGAPETGFGLVLATALSPVAIGLITSSILRIRKLKKQGFSVARTVKLAAALFATLSILSVGYEAGKSAYIRHGDAPKHEALRKANAVNANESITVGYATELLNSCKLIAVHDATGDSTEIGTEVKNSSDGIILVKDRGNPLNIWVNASAYVQLKPAIDNASKKCSNFRK